MAEKELRKLKRRELLKLLLIQCEEMDRLQHEYKEMRTDLEVFMESYERLKAKLNVKDERLSEKDRKIAELTRTIEELQESKAPMKLEDADSVMEASLRLNKIFEEAQRCADQYLRDVQRLSEKQLTAEKEPQESPVEAEKIPFEPALKSRNRKRQSLIQLGRRSSTYSGQKRADDDQAEYTMPLASSGDING